MKRISEKELDIMNVFWDMGQPMTKAQLMEKWDMGKGLHVNTVGTFLTRLEEKGYLTCEKKGRANLYRAAVSREQYLMRGMFGRWRKISVKDLVMNFCDVDKLNRKEREQLMAIMEKLEREREE